MKYNSTRRPGSDYSAPARATILEILETEALSIGEIADRVGRTHQTVGGIIKDIRSVIYIAEWVVGRGPHKPRYKVGNEPDAPKPDYMTSAERCKRYRMTEKGKKACAKCRHRWRRSKNGKEYTRRKDQARTARKRFEKGGIPAIDPLLGAIMGIGRAA